MTKRGGNGEIFDFIPSLSSWDTEFFSEFNFASRLDKISLGEGYYTDVG